MRIEVGDLVRIMDGGWNGHLALVMFIPIYNVARVKILDPIASDQCSSNGYVAYNTDSLEKL